MRAARNAPGSYEVLRFATTSDRTIPAVFRCVDWRLRDLERQGERKPMTDKELHKLSRKEVLQMLLAQAREAERLSGLLTETETQLHQLEETYERLRDRLDKKDLQIRTLRETLEAERNKRKIELEDAGSIAEAALRLNGVFEAAQKAADQYLESVREMYPRLGDGPFPDEELNE